MRKSGKFDQEVFSRYNASMVQLSDGHVSEMYQTFMLIYIGEDDEAVRSRLRIGEVTEAVVGFCEMMTIKLGVPP